MIKEKSLIKVSTLSKKIAKQIKLVYSCDCLDKDIKYCIQHPLVDRCEVFGYTRYSYIFGSGVDREILLVKYDDNFYWINNPLLGEFKFKQIFID